MRMGGEPVTDGTRLGALGIRIQGFQIMTTRFGGLVEILGVKIAEGKVRAAVIRISGQQLFQFGRSIRQIIGLLQSEREAVAGVRRIRLDGQSVLKRVKGCLSVAGSLGGQCEIVIGLEVGWIQLSGFSIGRQRVCEATVLLGLRAGAEELFGGGSVSR